MKSIIYYRQSPTRNGTDAKVLRASVENRGDTVVATFDDDPTILSKGKFEGWRALIGELAEANQVLLSSAADLPGRRVQDLLKILDLLRKHDVSLAVHREGIDTSDGPSAILDLVNVYRKVKLSEAIRRGILKAKQAGKIPGKPKVPEQVRRNIHIALRNGAGVRPTARRFNVSPASVINIRRIMGAEVDRLAA
jgi:DNA invertase Pin-like site-specific DNA recombinase